MVVRENTEDLYAGIGGFLKKHTADEVATQTAIYSRKGCERCIRWAFEFTRQRNNSQGKMLTLVAKTNVLTYGHDLWWRTFEDVAKEYPDVKSDYNPPAGHAITELGPFPTRVDLTPPRAERAQKASTRR